MLPATSIKEDYKVILQKVVCNIESKDCMLHRCQDCPGREVLENYLASVFEDCSPEDTFEFKQWVYTD